MTAADTGFVATPEPELEPGGEVVAFDELEYADEWDRWEALSPQQKADEWNRAESQVGGDRLWIVVAGQVVVEGGAEHRELDPEGVRDLERRKRLQKAAMRRDWLAAGGTFHSNGDGTTTMRLGRRRMIRSEPQYVPALAPQPMPAARSQGRERRRRLGASSRSTPASSPGRPERPRRSPAELGAVA